MAARKAASRAMPKWKPASPELVQSFEEALAGLPGVEARKMFGCPAAFTNGHMFSGLFQDQLFVRLSEADRVRLLSQGAKPFEPTPGRPMREYVVLPPAVLDSSRKLGSWLRKGVSYAQSLPPKAAGSARKQRD